MRNFIIALFVFVVIFIAYAFTHSFIKSDRHSGISIERQAQAKIQPQFERLDQRTG